MLFTIPNIQNVQQNRNCNKLQNIHNIQNSLKIEFQELKNIDKSKIIRRKRKKDYNFWNQKSLRVFFSSNKRVEQKKEEKN